jgi:hypothetical protein
MNPSRATIVLFGWLNLWNDTMATELEREPMELASLHLPQRGSKVEKLSVASKRRAPRRDSGGLTGPDAEL